MIVKLSFIIQSLLTTTNSYEYFSIYTGRGGSKSIPLKNIKMFCGKPLIYWNLLSLQKSSVDKIIVATDSNQIKSTVLSFSFSKVEVIIEIMKMQQTMPVQNQ